MPITPGTIICTLLILIFILVYCAADDERVRKMAAAFGFVAALCAVITFVCPALMDSLSQNSVNSQKDSIVVDDAEGDDGLSLPDAGRVSQKETAANDTWAETAADAPRGALSAEGNTIEAEVTSLPITTTTSRDDSSASGTSSEIAGDAYQGTSSTEKGPIQTAAAAPQEKLADGVSPSVAASVAEHEMPTGTARAENIEGTAQEASSVDDTSANAGIDVPEDERPPDALGTDGGLGGRLECLLNDDGSRCEFFLPVLDQFNSEIAGWVAIAFVHVAASDETASDNMYWIMETEVTDVMWYAMLASHTHVKESGVGGYENRPSRPDRFLQALADHYNYDLSSAEAGGLRGFLTAEKMLTGYCGDRYLRAPSENKPIDCIHHANGVGIFEEWLMLLSGKTVRLPTAAEWIQACAGPDGNAYPWGDDWDPAYTNVGSSSTEVLYPVKSVAMDTSHYGATGMSGYVQEWVTAGDTTMAAGGSYMINGHSSNRPFRCDSRVSVASYNAMRGNKAIGFRLVMEDANTSEAH